MKKRKFLAIALALAMVLSLTPMAALAADADTATTFDVEGIHYRVTGENEVEVYNPNYLKNASLEEERSDYTGDIVIPETVEHDGKQYNVIAIAAAAFNYADVSSVTLPDSIVRIEGRAFNHCNAVTITLGSGSKEIGFCAFNFCNKLESLTIPYGVETIGDEAFAWCTSLTSLTIPGSVTSIGKEAFSECGNLKTLTLNEGLTSIGANAFQLCGSLTDLTIPASVTNLTSKVGGLIGNALGYYSNASSVKFAEGSSFAIQDGILYNETEMMAILSEDLGDVVIPDGVTEIPEGFFLNQDTLTSIVIPEGVTEIPYEAFAGCVNLKKVQLPEGVTTIGDYAFDLTETVGDDYVNNDPKLEYINIPSTVTSLGERFLGGVQDGKTALIFEGEIPPTFANGALDGISGDGVNKPTVYYPAEAEAAYTDENGPLAQNALVSKPSEGGKTDNQYALSITENTASVEAGKTVQLTVTSTVPTGATLEWSSSNERVATVADGTITGVRAGTATITASIQLNGVTLTSDSCTVTVREAPSSGGSSTSDDDDDEPTYSVTVPGKVKHGDVTVRPKSAEKGDTVTITVDPDEGYEVDEVVVTDRKGNELKVKDKGNGKYTFTMPASKVEIDVTFVKAAEAPAVRFDDVPKGVWYYDAAIYAAKNGLMSGTGDDMFSPDRDTSRAMIWVMLARLDDQDVSVRYGNWYDKAQAWAVSAGVSDGSAPNGSVTREQLAVMLYSFAKDQGYKRTGSVSLSGYVDAGSVSPWAVDALEWAVGNGLISGTGDGLLAPRATATRAQVAVILMNFCEDIVR